jgi:hemerythrin-like domain-containing protein
LIHRKRGGCRLGNHRQAKPQEEAMPKSPEQARGADALARPPLPPIDALDAEHRQVLRALQELHALLEALGRDGVTTATRDAARRTCDFFTAHARAHHAAEERHVFPALLERGDPMLVRHVLQLQQDHGWLEENWLEIEPQLRAVAEGYAWYDLDLLRSALPVFEALYRDHIALEESVVYPEARRLQPAALA